MMPSLRYLPGRTRSKFLPFPFVPRRKMLRSDGTLEAVAAGTHAGSPRYGRPAQTARKGYIVRTKIFLFSGNASTPIGQPEGIDASSCDHMFGAERKMRHQSSRHVSPLTLIEGGPARRSGVQRKAMQDVEWAILMAHAQAGDAGAYRRLLEEITPYLRSLARRQLRDRHDIEDAVQDILLTVHTIRYTYDPTRPFAPWLVTIANRRLVDRLRRQGRTTRREAPLTAEHETFAAAEANIDEDVSNRHSLYEALQKLPNGQRQAIQLLKLGEMSLKEASAKTGLSVTALKVATHRALKNLRKLLSDGSRGT